MKTKNLKVPVALFTSVCLSLGACVVGEVGDDIEQVSPDAGAQDVIVHSEVVDDGRSMLHTFESEQMTYSMKIGKSGDEVLRLDFNIQTTTGEYSGFVEYEVTTGDEGVTFIPLDPARAEANALEMQRQLAGTDIEAYLLSGDIDLLAGVDPSELETFRSNCGSIYVDLLLLCGPTIAFALLGGVLTFAALAYLPGCALVWKTWFFEC